MDCLPSINLANKLDQLAARAACEPHLGEKVKNMIELAREISALAPWRRVFTLDEYVKLDDVYGRKMSYIRRCNFMTDKVNANHHAGALQDSRVSRLLLAELPFLAGAYCLSYDRKILAAIVEQLDEISGWNPLQRPGWTLREGSPTMSSPDGVWLATGTIIQAIALTLEALPEGTLPESLQQKINSLLLREQKLVESDWHNKVGWYIQQHMVQSNQWIVPNSALTIVGAMVGDITSERYCLGVNNTALTMEKLGTEGAVPEGFDYAVSWTATCLLLEGYFRNKAGDSSLWKNEFFMNLPGWLVQCYQPGRYCINAFDWWSGCRGAVDINKGAYIAQIAILTQNPQLCWIVRNKHRWLPPTLFGLLCLNITEEETACPPLYSSFKHAPWLSWRSSWDEKADGVWVRGKHHLDFHDHHDAGHVNYIKDGQLVLMESGTIDYSLPELETYRSLKGHNTVAFGENAVGLRNVDAPLSQIKVDENGGETVVDTTSVYSNAKKCLRHVKWDRKQLVVTDKIILNAEEDISVYWHLGSEQIAQIMGTPDTGYAVLIPSGIMKTAERGGVDWVFLQEEQWVKDFGPEEVSTPAISLNIQSSEPVTVVREVAHDHTMDIHQLFHEHEMIVVKSVKKIRQIEIVLTITASTEFEDVTPAE